VRVLILEDDPLVAFDLQAILEGDGHVVVSVCDSLAEARGHLEDDFDCALLDIDLIDGKSFAVAAVLMERHIPFTFVSASHPGDVPPPLHRASFIPKPFEEAAILRSIEEAVPGGMATVR
jgi:CheY-like chemotaxis protein